MNAKWLALPGEHQQPAARDNMSVTLKLKANVRAGADGIDY